MPEVTVETFREAALQSQIVTDEGDPDERTKLRDTIKGLLTDEDVGGTAERIAAKIEAMIWPEKHTEIKRKKAEYKVHKAAVLQMVREELNVLMEAERG